MLKDDREWFSKAHSKGWVSLAKLKGEGAPIHPDDVDKDLTETQYRRQLKAYYDHYGIIYECQICGRCAFKDGSGQAHRTSCNKPGMIVKKPSND
jgi:hypothetical protein